MPYLLLKVCLLLSPVFFLQPEAEAVSVPPLPAAERQKIEWALQVLERVQQEWPRQTPLPPCIVLFGAEAQWLLGCRSVPPGVVPVIGQIFAGEPVYASTAPLILPHVRVPYAQVGASVVGQGLLYMPQVPASEPYRAQPWFLIQRQEDLQRQHPAFQNITDTEWLSLFVHEVFHMLMQLPEPGIAAQLARAGQPEGGFVDQEALKAFYRQEPELQALLAAEHRLLREGLSAGPLSSAEARALLQQWWVLYQQRLERFGAAFDGHYAEWDAFWTFLEGTARYIESRLLIDPAWQPPGMAANPLAQRGTYADLPPVNRSIAAHYYYAIGMHLAFVMDAIDPHWSDTVFSTPGWLVGQVKKMLHPPSASCSGGCQTN